MLHSIIHADLQVFAYRACSGGIFPRQSSGLFRSHRDPSGRWYARLVCMVCDDGMHVNPQVERIGTHMGWAAKRGAKYRAMYRDAEGNMKSAGTFDRKRDAQIAADTAEAADRSGGNTDVLTWAEWWPEWWKTRTVAPSTLEREQQAIAKYLEPRWGDVLLVDIKHLEVQEWVAELARTGMAATTVAKLRNILSGSLRAAMAKGLVSANPCQGVTLPKPGPSPDRFLSDEECAAIRMYLDPEQQFLFDVLVGTGARFGEALGLHWEDVHLGAKPRITIRWAYDRVDHAMKAPKSNQIRTVPISKELARQFADRLKRDGMGEPAKIPYRGSREPHTGPVYVNRNDTEWRYAWRAAVRVATVGKGAKKRKVGAVRTHDLRHTYASRLVQKGAALQTVKDLLGHSTVGLTERYARLAPNKFDDVRDLL